MNINGNVSCVVSKTSALAIRRPTVRPQAASEQVSDAVPCRGSWHRGPRHTLVLLPIDWGFWGQTGMKKQQGRHGLSGHLLKSILSVPRGMLWGKWSCNVTLFAISLTNGLESSAFPMPQGTTHVLFLLGDHGLSCRPLPSPRPLCLAHPYSLVKGSCRTYWITPGSPPFCLPLQIKFLVLDCSEQGDQEN
jgi:hypothetical protein